jgi:CDGSH iron-sulfur domain-containing protein 3
MTYPKVHSTSPTPVTVEEGKTYAWCTCGLSDKNPFCDGKHKTIENEEWKSLKFTATETKEVWLCNCKHTKNPPYCDGSHKQLG